MYALRNFHRRSLCGLWLGRCLALLFISTLASWADAVRDFGGLADNRIPIRTLFGARSARALDGNHAELTIGMSVTRACERADSYRLISFQDDAYAYAKFVRPKTVSVSKELEAEGPTGCPFSRFERTVVTLEMPTPLKLGMEYLILAQGSEGEMVTGAHTAQGFVFQVGKETSTGTSDVDLAVLGLRQMTPVGPGMVRLEFGPGFSVTAGSRLENYGVRVAGKPIKAIHLGRITKVDTYLPSGWPFAAIPLHEIFLQLERPYDEGDPIEVEINPAVTTGARRASLRFSAKTSLSYSIKANQLGYLTDSPIKTAYLGQWMGSFPESNPFAAKPSAGIGPEEQSPRHDAQDARPDQGGSSPETLGAALWFPTPPEFRVCREADGTTVFRGQAQLTHRTGEMTEGYFKVDHSGENVYRLDFTAFKAPGRYFLSIDQVGRSLPFAIGEDVYQQAFETQSYGVFAQRCGIELGPPYSVWHRIACHKRGLVLTTQNRNEPHQLQDLPKKAQMGPDGVPLTLSTYGGHHDAGDYNPRSHLDVAQVLMEAYEMAPQKFYDGQLNLPEKGNGVPDILDEAFWALRLWQGLQEADGGVHNGTESAGDPNFIETVELDHIGDYAYAKDAAASYGFAGAMAQASRLWRSIGKTHEAEDFLARAQQAYQWAEKHPPATKTAADEASQYSGPKAYAAAQLLHTTGDPRFNQDFLAVCVWSRNPSAEFEVYQQYDQSRAAWAYVNCPKGSVDLRIQDAVRQAILQRADFFIRHCQTMAYSFIRHPMAPINWGTGAYENYLPVVMWAYKLTGDEQYRSWMVRTCDNTLGANPLNRSYIVGLGTRTVHAPLHNSRYSHFGEVVSGQQVQGPVQSGDGYRVAEVAYPAIRVNFASLQTFVDSHFAINMDEGVVIAQANSMAAFGLLLPDRPRH